MTTADHESVMRELDGFGMRERVHNWCRWLRHWLPEKPACDCMICMQYQLCLLYKKRGDRVAMKVELLKFSRLMERKTYGHPFYMEPPPGGVERDDLPRGGRPKFNRWAPYIIDRDGHIWPADYTDSEATEESNSSSSSSSS